MDIQSAYDRWSATYDTDANLTRDLDSTVTRAELENRQFDWILEMGCGTGKNTVLFTQIATRVLSVDFSRGMLTMARHKAASVQAAFCAADLTRSWPFSGLQADLIAFNLVLEHISDLGFLFSEACRCLAPNGTIYVSELHPFRQYQGKKARFEGSDGLVEIPAYIHHISEFLKAAGDNGLALEKLQEWWHDADRDQPPRLVTFLFRKSNPHPG